MCGLKCVIEIDVFVSLFFLGKLNFFSFLGGLNFN